MDVERSQEATQPHNLHIEAVGWGPRGLESRYCSHLLQAPYAQVGEIIGYSEVERTNFEFLSFVDLASNTLKVIESSSMVMMEKKITLEIA